MAFDYNPIALEARALLTEFGRTVTFVQMNNVPDNTAQPWLGSSTARVAVASLEVDAVFVEPSSLNTLGRQDVQLEFVERSEQIGLVSTDTDLHDFNEIIDTDGTRWKITGLSELKPGLKSMLYFVGVYR